jgi:hypothetical protein
MTADITFHYPPELFNLLVDTIPALNKSKRDVLIFFRGAGVPEDLLKDLAHRVEADPQGISKAEIARTVLERLNKRPDFRTSRATHGSGPGTGLIHFSDLQKSPVREPLPINRADLVIVRDRINEIVRAIDAVVV